MPAVQRGQRGPDAVGAGGQDEVLHRPVDGRAQPGVADVGRVAEHREDPHRRVRDVPGQVLGGQEGRQAQPVGSGRRGQDLLPAAAVGGVPAGQVPLGHLPFDGRVGDHHPAPPLPVAAGRAADGRVEQSPDDLVGDRLGGQVPARRSGVQRVEHRQRLGAVSHRPAGASAAAR